MTFHTQLSGKYRYVSDMGLTLGSSQAPVNTEVHVLLVLILGAVGED